MKATSPLIVSAMLSISLTAAGWVTAQEAAEKPDNQSAEATEVTVDPTGTWVWEQEFGGNTSVRQLTLEFVDGQVKGVYKSADPPGRRSRRGSSEPAEISNAKLDGDELVFEVTRKFGDREFTTTYACVIAGDELAGFTQVSFGGQVRESAWMASRVIEVDDAIRELASAVDDGDTEQSTATSETNAADLPTGLVAAVDTAPQRVPTPSPEADGPYQPQAILQGGIVIPLYAPDSSVLNQERVSEAEQYNMTNGVPGRIQSIVNIHNPSIEIHRASPSMNTGAVVIVAAGGGHRTLNVGTEGADFVPYFFNYGVNTVILRNRLRSDGYEPETDAVHDAMQAIRLVRKYSEKWQFDPNKIGIMGFSAGAELAAPAAVMFETFDAENSDADDPLVGTTSRPDFVGIIYPGPTPFTRDSQLEVPRNAPPAFITCAGAGDRGHAIWADDYFRAMLNAGIPNVEMHIYGNGYHPGTRRATGGLTHRDGIPFGKWPDRFIDWFKDLGFLGEPGVETKAAVDLREFASRPPERRRGFGRAGFGRRSSDGVNAENAPNDRGRGRDRPQPESAEND